jgi:hypothetical protein
MIGARLAITSRPSMRIGLPHTAHEAIPLSTETDAGPTRVALAGGARPVSRCHPRRLALTHRETKFHGSVGDSGPAESDETPPLYAYAHDRQWFQETIPREWNVDIRCWSIIDQSFTKKFVPDNLFGRYILGTIYWLETLFPHSLAWIGYQTIVIRKNNPDAKLSGIAVRT